MQFVKAMVILAADICSHNSTASRGTHTQSPVLLQKEGLKVKDVVVLIDREQGGSARMASNGLKLYSAFTLSFILETLVKHSLVSHQVAASVKSFIAANQTFKEGDAATKASADAPTTTAPTPPEAAAAAKAAADAACAAPMPALVKYKR